MTTASDVFTLCDPNRWRDRGYEFCLGMIEGLPPSSKACCAAAFAAAMIAPDSDDDTATWLKPRQVARRLGRMVPLLATGLVVGGVAVVSAALLSSTAPQQTFNSNAKECAAIPVSGEAVRVKEKGPLTTCTL
jgi:hypothetical protein